jgi:TolB-like protein
MQAFAETPGPSQGRKGADDKNEAPASSQPSSAESRPLTVAILDFETRAPAADELGSQIGEVLTAMLSGEPGYTLVDRATLTRTLQEHELNLSGVVETAQAVKVGKITGARILVTGKAFALGKRLFVTAKLIGTETSLVEGVLVKADHDADVGDLIIDLAKKIADTLQTSGRKLIAGKGPIDPFPELKKKLSKLRLPRVAIVVTETHHAGRPQIAVIDPAVETEIKMMLQQCGFKVLDVKENSLADWACTIDKDKPAPWPQDLKKVDIVITGEAFSELGARIGNLVSCSARAEINLISRNDGRIILAERATYRAVDLSEHIAGKTALQKAGRGLAIRVLEHFVKEHEKNATGDQPARK